MFLLSTESPGSILRPPGQLLQWKWGVAGHGSVFNVDNTNIELRNVTFTKHPVPFRLKGAETHLVLVNCQFDASGWAKQIAAAEIFGNRAASFWSPELAVGRAKDEVRSTSLHVPIGEYINTKKQKTVLVMGDYSIEGAARLDAIRLCLEDLGYNPFLVKDVPDIFGADIRQKVVILGGLAQFVVFDDSSPSGHLSEVIFAQQNSWITVLLHANGARGSSMTAGLGVARSDFHEEDYDPTDPCGGVARATAWTESRIAGLEKDYQRVFPWRKLD